MPVVDQPPRCGHEEGLPLPAALVGISGAYDLNPTGNAAHANATADPC
jgi:hypothetical protein